MFILIFLGIQIMAIIIAMSARGIMRWLWASYAILCSIAILFIAIQRENHIHEQIGHEYIQQIIPARPADTLYRRVK